MYEKEYTNYNKSMDAKLTLKRLHERFPEMTLDDLFAVLECIEETPVYQPYTIGTTRYPDYTVTCSSPVEGFQTITK